MKTFKLTDSQTGTLPFKESFEAESLEKAQAEILESEGLAVEEIEDPNSKKKVSYEDLVEAFIDVLDGQSNWWEIREQTGRSEERSKEITEIFRSLIKQKGGK